MITVDTYLPPLFENGVLRYKLISENRIRIYSMIPISNRAKGKIGTYAKRFLRETLIGEYSFSFNSWSEKNERGHTEYVIEAWYRGE